MCSSQSSQQTLSAMILNKIVQHQISWFGHDKVSSATTNTIQKTTSSCRKLRLRFIDVVTNARSIRSFKSKKRRRRSFGYKFGRIDTASTAECKEGVSTPYSEPNSGGRLRVAAVVETLTPEAGDEETINCGKRSLRTLKFPNFEHTLDELEEEASKILLDALHQAGKTASPTEIYEFVASVRTAYYDLPYHSFRHAFDVMQAMYVLLSNDNLRALLSPNDPSLLLLAALLHDVGHNGKTNNVLRRTQHELCKAFGEMSTLECLHSKLACELLEKFKIDECCGIETANFSFIKTLILFTDIERHAEFIKSCEEGIRNNGILGTHDLFCGLLLKICDISNLTRDCKDADKWGDQLAQEGVLLFQYCESLGIEPGEPNPAVAQKDRAIRSLQFANGFVKPLLSILETTCPGSSSPFVAGLERNVERWNELVQGQAN